MIAGVAAGLGEYFDVDPVLFRVGFVVLAFVWGLALPVYLAAWLLIPSAPGTAPHGRVRGRVGRTIGQWPRWFSIAVVAGGIALLFSRLGPRRSPWGFFGPDIVWGAALILLGVLLYRHASDRESHDEPITIQPPTQATTPTGTAAAWESETAAAGSEWTEPVPPLLPAGAEPVPPVGPALASTAVVAAPAAPTAPLAVAASSPPRRRRHRSALGWITLGAVLLGVGVAALFDQSGAMTIAPVRYPALALAIIGVGLLVGTLWGRARWLAIFGILLLPIVFAASVIDVPIAGGVGSRFTFLGTTSSIQPAYRLAAGVLDIDAHDMRFDVSSASLTATVTAGRLRVTVPDDAYVIVHAAVGIGTIEVRSESFDPADRTREGTRIRLDQAFGSPTAETRLVLNLGAGFGEVDVIRAPPDQPVG